MKWSAFKPACRYHRHHLLNQATITNTNTMEQSQKHPIDGADWHKAYPIPSSEPVKSVMPDELAAKMLSKEEGAGPGKSYLIVDVRRSDCKVRGANR